MNTESSFQSTPETGKATASSRGWVWRTLKWTLFVLVIVFVGKQGYELWNEDKLQHIEINFFWLVPAIGVYLLGSLPAVWYWQRLMQSFGGDVSFRDSLRAYYCAQLGKYIPGKATVLIIRAGMIKGRGLGAAAAAITATCETLIMMGAGLALALALSPMIVRPEWINSIPDGPFVDPFVVVIEWINSIPNGPFVVPCVVVIACLVALPIIATLLSHLAVKMTPAELVLSKKEMRIPAKGIGSGLIAFVITWILFGLSLGLTIRSVSVNQMNFGDWPVWTGAVSAATVIGFLAIFAPGGIGVREGLLLMVLSLHIPEKQAVAAVVLLRLVWLVAEITAAGVLYYMVRPSNHGGLVNATDLSSDQKKDE
ncbi:MAG: flippase-like domain-containing protein [Planctomycetes bacterium]|nr:flippase-like domain-containing protein [Planctomycetota bacterium]